MKNEKKRAGNPIQFIRCVFSWSHRWHQLLLFDSTMAWTGLFDPSCDEFSIITRATLCYCCHRSKTSVMVSLTFASVWANMFGEPKNDLQIVMFQRKFKQNSFMCTWWTSETVIRANQGNSVENRRIDFLIHPHTHTFARIINDTMHSFACKAQFSYRKNGSLRNANANTRRVAEQHPYNANY